MTPQQALARLQAQCSRSEMCGGQVRKRLQKWSMAQQQKGQPGFSDSQIEEILEALVKEKFVDDVRFAGAYVRDKARFSGWGVVKIAYNLKGLGVGEEVIKEALAENMECFDSGRLQDILQKKWNSLKSGLTYQQKRDKVLRFALGRGFQYGQIMDIIKDFK
ncbi:MAG: RecX family transcriptional regulator [Bacteroidales bacterium]|nr:RecX family transcriptional regulator [Bacteroidales bacterium]